MQSSWPKTTRQHGDKDQELSGTWVSLELQKAVEKGYKITQIAEVWTFEQQTDSLFKGDVKMFLKPKHLWEVLTREH